MNLNEYFASQHSAHISQEQKLAIYDKIVRKQAAKAHARRHAFSRTKTFIYTGFMSMFIIGLYGTYFFNTPQTGENDLVAFSSTSLNMAQADFVAKVIDFQGTYYIEKDGQMLQSSIINNGDVVLLKEKTQMVFTISSGTQAKIVGPAKFTILEDKINKKYTLNLAYGEFVQMQSIGSKQSSSVDVMTDTIKVAQLDRSKPMDFQLIKTGTNSIITNKGAKLLVTTTDGKKTSQSVATKQVLAVRGNDISLFANVDDFAKAIKNKNISQTFALQSSSQASEGAKGIQMRSAFSVQNITGEEMSLLAETDLEQTSQEDEIQTGESLTNSPLSAQQSKKVPSEQQMKVFASLYVEENMQDISTAYKANDTVKFTTAIASLERKLEQVGDVFGVKYIAKRESTKTQILALQSFVGSIKKAIELDYFMPPKQTKQITSIKTWIDGLARF